eukprot:CAMPEP_0172808382 /NCGR_PEP_ID=MMETSP1075-20121228/7658_1 /TAXON_ID=2916 /ORGANISM="Ceratium fusus, Strain PA161109" /LENGTH=77 /DNA_ID=CAMNT_0013647533 /DNA_START=398 /DNA_END=630 /DNA_ORIENTATION=+
MPWYHCCSSVKQMTPDKIMRQAKAASGFFCEEVGPPSSSLLTKYPPKYNAAHHNEQDAKIQREEAAYADLDQSAIHD